MLKWHLDTGIELGHLFERNLWDPLRIFANQTVKFHEVQLIALFRLHDIVPTWINSHYTWGWYDAKLGEWTGASGKVRREATF